MIRVGVTGSGLHFVSGGPQKYSAARSGCFCEQCMFIGRYFLQFVQEYFVTGSLISRLYL